MCIICHVLQHLLTNGGRYYCTSKAMVFPNLKRIEGQFFSIILKVFNNANEKYCNTDTDIFFQKVLLIPIAILLYKKLLILIPTLNKVLQYQ